MKFECSCGISHVRFLNSSNDHIYDFECEDSKIYTDVNHPCYYREIKSEEVTYASECLGDCGGEQGRTEELVVYRFESPTCMNDVCTEIISGRRGTEKNDNHKSSLNFESEMRISRTRPCLTRSCGLESTVSEDQNFETVSYKKKIVDFKSSRIFTIRLFYDETF